MKPAKNTIISRRINSKKKAFEFIQNAYLNMHTTCNNHTQRSTITAVLFSVLFLFASCADSSRYKFESSAAALSFYKDYHQGLQQKKNMTSVELLKVIEDWKEVSDTVFHFLQKDPAFFAHAGLSMDYSALSDSIKMELMRVAYDGDYGLKDLSVLKFSGKMAEPSADLQNMFEHSSMFFEQLGKQQKEQDSDSHYGFNNYVKFLDRYRSANFDLPSLKSFIVEEDKFFQEYLNRIDENINEDLTLITKRTEDVCQRIFLSANDGLISDTTALVYMAMRTNRRLIMNAEKCMELVKKNQVNSIDQANVYLWMLIQPFLSIDQFQASLLTREQKQALFVLAESYDSAMKKMVGKKYLEKDVIDVLPKRIIKLFITTL